MRLCGHFDREMKTSYARRVEFKITLHLESIEYKSPKNGSYCAPYTRLPIHSARTGIVSSDLNVYRSSGRISVFICRVSVISPLSCVIKEPAYHIVARLIDSIHFIFRFRPSPIRCRTKLPEWLARRRLQPNQRHSHNTKPSTAYRCARRRVLYPAARIGTVSMGACNSPIAPKSQPRRPKSSLANENGCT